MLERYARPRGAGTVKRATIIEHGRMWRRVAFESVDSRRTFGMAAVIGNRVVALGAIFEASQTETVERFLGSFASDAISVPIP